jgi:hypothetical protein
MYYIFILIKNQSADLATVVVPKIRRDLKQTWILSWAVTLEISARRRSNKPVNMINHKKIQHLSLHNSGRPDLFIYIFLEFFKILNGTKVASKEYENF